MNNSTWNAVAAGLLLTALAAAPCRAQECPTVDAEANMKTLGISYYPPSGRSAGNFVPSVTVGKTLYLAGNGPRKPDGKLVVGKLGPGPGQLNVEQGYEASKFTAISLLSVMKNELGDLNKVKRLVKVLGMVNSDPAFTDQPKVINGASDLFIQIFGECGRHARSAVGISSLVNDMAVEIELIAELR